MNFNCVMCIYYYYYWYKNFKCPNKRHCLPSVYTHKYLNMKKIFLLLMAQYFFAKSVLFSVSAEKIFTLNIVYEINIL